MEQEALPAPQDGMIHLARLLSEIGVHDLGPLFMETLTGVVLGAEGLDRMHTGGVSGEDMWAVNCSTTAQRTQAAEQVLQQHRVDVLRDETP